MSSEISFSSLGENDYRETVDLLTETFCRNDPVEIAMKITPDEFRVMIEPELDAVLNNGLSIAARNPKTGRLIGTILASDALADTVDSRGKVSKKFEPISEIARDFHHFYLSTRSVQSGTCLYLFVIGIHPDFSGHGFGKKLTGEVLNCARRKGYRSAFSLTTNLASTRILKHFKFEPIKTQDYQSYRFQGVPVFSSITDHPGINLMELADLRTLAN